MFTRRSRRQLLAVLAATTFVALLVWSLRDRDFVVDVSAVTRAPDPAAEPLGRRPAPVEPAPESTSSPGPVSTWGDGRADSLATAPGPTAATATELSAPPGPTEPAPEPADSDTGSGSNSDPRLTGEHGARLLSRFEIQDFLLFVNGESVADRFPESDRNVEIERTLLVRDTPGVGGGGDLRDLLECELRVRRSAEPFTGSSPAPTAEPPELWASACSVLRRIANGGIEVVEANRNAPAHLAPWPGQSLAHARWDLSIPGFLPPGGRAPSGSWDLPKQRFLEWLEPGGDLLWLRPASADPSSFAPVDPDENWLWRTLTLATPTGEWSARYVGLRVLDGIQRHVAELRLDLQYHVTKEHLLDTPRANPVATEPLRLRLDCTFTGIGAVAWDPDGARPPTAELHASCESRLDLSSDATEGRPALNVFLVLAGRLAFQCGAHPAAEHLRTAIELEPAQFLAPESLAVR